MYWKFVALALCGFLQTNGKHIVRDKWVRSEAAAIVPPCLTKGVKKVVYLDGKYSTAQYMRCEIFS